VVLAGGGTAGHVEPALSLADALRRRDPSIAITLLGTPLGLEARLVPARGYDLELIPSVPIPRRPTPDLLRVPTRLSRAVKAAAVVLREKKADVLVGFGGYVAGPAYLAARRTSTPVVVHEANARPGWANRLGARGASAVATAGPDVPMRGRPIGIPLRRSIATLDRAAMKAEARAAFGLDPTLSTLLVFGGSQGSRRLNQAALGAARSLAEARIQVLHASGRNNPLAVDLPEGSPPYVIVEYLDRMDLAYAAADLALCRAGAITCAELTAVGLPGAYVPLPIGNGEQRLNAEPIVRAAGGLLVEDDRCTPAWVSQTLIPALMDQARLDTMGRAAAALGHRDADERLADLVLAVAEGRTP
jgi:UDP-N-acetylglucosamine--N-acetylmuramyl-(pentapeptide) pyrophosphoryl-undecaprenol N-acetylglucosamine transferase